MGDVWIPDNPPERTYTCPWCKKGVHCFRIGESCSYWVMDAADPKQEHECKPPAPKKGFSIPRELLGYKPPKVKKDETTT